TMGLMFVVSLSNLVTQAQISKQKGITYTSNWSGGYSHPDSALALPHVKATGANWISLIVTRYQDDISSTTIYATPGTETDTGLIDAITQAHNLGLKVMLKPHLDLANDPTHWRAEIGQGFTEAQWAAWFASYQAFITHYAHLAQDHAVDQFCIGVELSTPQSRDSNWRTVIASVRSHYSGPITYAANWDATDLTWWDAVDYIGVDAYYYPLTNKKDPTVAELKLAWQPYVTSLAALASTWNKSILFTEIGYHSQDGIDQCPYWCWQPYGTIDLQEQADHYQALFEAVYNQPWFAGIFWFVWYPSPFDGGSCDSSFSPHDKPAEDVLRTWYGAPPRIPDTPQPQPQPNYERKLVIYADSLGSGWENWSWDSVVDLSSTNPVYSGTRAISVTAQPGGALCFYHLKFGPSSYYWLEFYIRGSSVSQEFRAFIYDENGVMLRYLPVCRYAEGEMIEPGIWKRARLPLSDLNATGRLVENVCINNWSEVPFSYWVDEIRLLGATWKTYLPVVIKNRQ
ncbi:MAG: hypothetical protein AB1801_14450, partial [Chloroflexota bacterium]